MKSLVVFSFLALSFSAHADYFGCTLKYSTFLSASVEAEYRVLEARVQGGTFICEGKIVNDETIVTITSTETGESRTNRERHSTAQVNMAGLNQWGDGQDYGECKCGMN